MHYPTERIVDISCGTGIINSLINPSRMIDPMTQYTINRCSTTDLCTTHKNGCSVFLFINTLIY